MNKHKNKSGFGDGLPNSTEMGGCCSKKENAKWRRGRKKGLRRSRRRFDKVVIKEIDV